MFLISLKYTNSNVFFLFSYSGNIFGETLIFENITLPWKINYPYSNSETSFIGGKIDRFSIHNLKISKLFYKPLINDYSNI